MELNRPIMCEERTESLYCCCLPIKPSLGMIQSRFNAFIFMFKVFLSLVYRPFPGQVFLRLVTEN